MSTFNMEIFGSANLKQPINQFGTLTTMVQSLNAEMQRLVQLQGVATNPKGYAAMSRAVAHGSTVFRNAAASTGVFASEQLRVNSATESYTKALQKQKLTFRGWYKDRSLANKAFQEQLMLQQMMVRQLPNTRGGKTLLDVVRPTSISAVGNAAELARQKMGWFNAQLKSSSKMMVNWGKNTQWAGRQLMVGLTLPIVALGAVTGKLFYDMDQQLTRIQKVYNTTANQFSKDAAEQMRATTELDRVRADSTNVAVNAAKEYGASMSDTLDVTADLAAAGFQGSNLLQSTTEVMKNATLGEIDHQTAMKATIAIQQIMRYNTKQTADTWAYMNAVENATSLQMKDFASAIPIALGPLQQMGGDVKDLGTLLTAMVSRGMQVGKAANAIKAGMQRLFRPSQQIKDEWQAIANVNLDEMIDRSGGDLMKLLHMINAATSDIQGAERNKLFAGLFGSYQVGAFNNMLAGLDDVKNGIGQTSTAFKIANQDAKTWRKIQEREISTWQQSAAGKFKTAVATIKAELATAGKIFLEAGTTILGVLTGIIDKFNELPTGVKKGIAIGGILTALVGPIIMLVGLFANLGGNILRIIASIGGLLVKFEVLDKETAAAKLIAKATEDAWDKMATSAERNAMMISKMTAAMNDATLAQQNMMRQSMGLPMIPTAFPGGYNPRGVTQTKNGSWRTPSGPGYPGVFAKRPIGIPTVPALNGIVSPTMFPQSVVTAAPQVEKNTEKIQKHMSGAAVSGGIFAAAMATTMLSSNDTVDHIAQIAMMSAIIAPGLLYLVRMLMLINAQMIKNAATSIGSAIAQSAAWASLRTVIAETTIAVGMSNNIMAASGAAAVGFGRAIYTIVGPLGLLIAALAAAWIGINKVKDAAHEAADEYNAMYNDAKPLAEIFGYAYTEQSQLEYKGDAKRLTDLQKMSGEYAGIISNIREAEGEQAKYNEALRIGMQVISSGGTVEQAKEATSLALQAAQDISAKEANRIILQFGGDMKGVEWVVKNAVTTAQQAMNDATDKPTDKGFWEGVWQDATSGWDTNVFKIDWEPSDVTVTDKTIASLQSAARDMRSIFTSEANKPFQTQFFTTMSDELTNIDDKIASTSGDEQAVWKDMRVEFVKAQFAAAGMSDTLDHMPAQFAATANAAEVLRALQGDISLQTEITYLEGKKHKSILEQVHLAQLYVEQGYNRAVAAAKKTTDNIKGASDAADSAARAANRFADALKAAKSISLSDVFQGAMQDIQQEIADRTKANFETQRDAALAAVQAAGEARLNAFDNRADAASNAMDKRFADREAHIQNMYDGRIKAIQDVTDAEQEADDIRQKLFDAEMARMDRLNEAANRNIDFNAALNAGNFDEAAKIRNDAAAESGKYDLQKELDRADARSERRSKHADNRITRLEDTRDAALDNLKKIEDAEKNALQRSLDRKREALNAEVEADNAAAQKMWDTRSDFLDKALDKFTGYTATSSKDLLKHMKNWEGEYGKFDLSTGKMFNRTVDDINTYLRGSISDSRKQLMNDARWETMGTRIATKMIRGAFGMSKEEFWNWMAGGKPPGMGKHGKKQLDNQHGAGGYDPTTQQHSPNTKRASGGVLPGWTPGRDVHHFTSPTAGNLHLSGGEAIMRPEFTRAVGGPAGVAALNNAVRRGQVGGTRGDGFADGGVFGFTGIMARGLGEAMSNAMDTAITSAGEWAQARDTRKAARQAANLLSGIFRGIPAGNFGGAFLDGEQIKNAVTISNVGQNLGASARDIQIALITALVESGLRNLDYGDRDSVGLFQQRAPWGSYAERTNPEKSAKMFFTGGSDFDGYSEPGLFDIAGRDKMSMGEAAQAVQVSAYPDRYAEWVPTAQALYQALLQAAPRGSSSYAPGSGGWHRASEPGNGWANSHDYLNPYHTPLYAVNDGNIVESSELPPSAGSGQDPGAFPRGFGSYGVTVVLKTKDGDYIRYAHMWPGTEVGIGSVKGGQKLGESAATGNATGPHTHFEVNKQEIAREWFAAHGIGLSKGAANVNYDGVPAVLHKGEAVLTDDLNAKFKKGVDMFSNPDSIMTALWHGAIKAADKIIPKKEQQQTGESGSVRIGTYNVAWPTPVKTTPPDIKQITKYADIIGLQEVYGNRVRPVRKALNSQGWKMSPWKDDSVVTWNNAMYEGVRGGNVMMNPKHHSSGGFNRNRVAAWETLRSRNTGGKITVISAHTQPWAYKDAATRAIQIEQYHTLANMIKQFKGIGPTVLVGDLNQGLTQPGGKLLKILGLESNWANGRQDKSNKPSHKGGGFIDHIMFGDDMKFIKNRVISSVASDHNATFTHLGIPGLAKGTQFVRNDNTLANLHHGEAVLTKDITARFQQGVDRFAEGPNATYNLNMHFNGDVNNKEELARFVIKSIQMAERRKPQSRTR